MRFVHRTGELCNLLEGARTAGTRCLHRRSLQQLGRAFGRLGPPPVAFPAPAPAPAPEDNANSSTYQLTNLGPIQSVGVTYEVYAVPQPVSLAFHVRLFFMLLRFKRSAIEPFSRKDAAVRSLSIDMKPQGHGVCVG